MRLSMGPSSSEQFLDGDGADFIYNGRDDIRCISNDVKVEQAPSARTIGSASMFASAFHFQSHDMHHCVTNTRVFSR
jgi:hypothetical protein